MPKRRSKGEGSIKAVKKDGKIVGYRGRLRLNGEEFYGPQTKRRSDALPALNGKLAKEVAKMDAEPPTLGPKFSSSMRLLIDNRLTQEWRPKTVELARTVLRRLEKSWLGDYGILEIRSSDIIKWRLSLDVAPGTAHRYQRMIERVLALLGNKVTAEKPKLREPSIRILTREEQRQLIARAVQPRTRLALLILLDWGLRSGEACGLMHEDRHEDGVWLRRQVTEVNGKATVDTTLKTDESRAWLPILDPEVLAAIGPPRKGFVLACENGNPMRPSNLRRMIKSVAEGTAFEGITPQELRHTAGVNLLRAGVDPATAASITRHSIETLLKIYHRVTQEGKIEAMEKLKIWRNQG